MQKGLTLPSQVKSGIGFGVFELVRAVTDAVIAVVVLMISALLWQQPFDAAEWVGPYNDVTLGLHKAARYYYYPGFQEPGPSEECIINLDAWNSLPADLQEIVRISCQSINLDIQAEYNFGNTMALEQLRQDPDVELREVPDEIFNALREYAQQAADELAESDEFSARVQASINDYLQKSSENLKLGELTYLNKRLASQGP